MHIGPALAEARTEAGMSVEDVSERTRIRRTIISDIERDDYASCGGDFYARGHIRAIAKVVGADPVPLIKEYDEGVVARDNPEPQTGPDPATWLAANGSAGLLDGQPPAAGSGPGTWPQPPAAPPAGAGSDTAPQQAVTAGPPARFGSGATAADALRDAAAGAGRAGADAVQRAARWLRQVRPEVPGRTGSGRGQGEPEQFRAAVVGLRGRSAEALQRISRLRTADQRPSRIIGGLAIMLAALLLVLYGIFSGSAHGSARPGSHAHSAGTSHPSHPAQSARPGSSKPSATAPAAALLLPVRAAAFGPGGLGDGDNPQSAGQALRAGAGGWHTNWYTTARFGGLQRGTGLLLDMGRTVVLSRVAIRLGPAPGAVVQLRAGNAPLLRKLRPVAAGVSGGGRLVLAPRTPAHGRYLLIWFTRLPPDNAGTYQATIDGITMLGYRARP